MLDVQSIVLFAFAGLLVWAAMSDLISYLIPNRVCLAVVAIYPAYVLAGLFGGETVQWTNGLLAAGVAFVGGFILFNYGLAGGGDVKLLSATALWAGFDGLMPLLLITALAGGLLSLGVMAAKTVALLRGPAALRPAGGVALLRAAMTHPAPYGAAIAIGGLFIALQRAGLLNGL